MSKRIKFFLSHLSISAIIALIASSIIFCVWYPSPLAIAVGVMHIVLMMLAIDMVIGPLFTLLVYKEGKKTLKFDLTVIVLVQLFAFMYGFYSIAQGRPAWIVYNVDGFELIRVNDIYQKNLKDAQQPYQQPSWSGAQYTAVQFAKDIKQRNENMFTEVLGGISLAQRPERYVPLLQAQLQIKQCAQELNQLNKFNSADQVKKILIKYPQANAWVPLKAANLDMVVLINKQTAQVVKIVDLRPWK